MTLSNTSSVLGFISLECFVCAFLVDLSGCSSGQVFLIGSQGGGRVSACCYIIKQYSYVHHHLHEKRSELPGGYAILDF